VKYSNNLIHTTIFQKNYICDSGYICNKDCKFACDQSNIKGTLLEEQSTFLAVCQLPTEGFSLHICHSAHVHYK